MKLLAWYEQVYVFTKYYCDLGTHCARNWLGPAPQNYLLLPDGQVLPSTVRLPTTVSASSYIYDPITNRITSLDEDAKKERYRPLQYIALRIESDIVGNIDMSDWLGEIRACPVPLLSVQQILVLWCLTHNAYIPFDGSTRAYATKNNGEEESLVF